MNLLRSWIRERVPIDPSQLRELTNEPVPNHLKRWWFCLGGTPAYLLVVQIVTGILLAFYYQASPSSAYESVQTIDERAAFGWYFRSLHKWGATLMVAAVILHQIRIYFTGAYRRPRELNWIIGMCLLGCTLLIGFTGYSLIYEHLSYWGATVAANISDAIPVVGSWGKRLLLGGDDYNDKTLSRFYIIHAAVLPVTMIVLIMMHIMLIRLHGVARLDAEQTQDQGTFNFFPNHLLTEMGIGLFLMVILNVLATLFPPGMGPKADPLTTPEIIKPEWYFYVSFRWLKLFSLSFAVISTGFIVTAMFLWPWIDGLIIRITKNREISTYIGIVAVVALISLTLWEALVTH